MCSSIKTLRRPDAPVSDEEVRAAALQFVRKACPERSRRVSGYRAPSQANEAAFNRAVDSIAVASRRLLASLKSR